MTRETCEIFFVSADENIDYAINVIKTSAIYDESLIRVINVCYTELYYAILDEIGFKTRYIYTQFLQSFSLGYRENLRQSFVANLHAINH